MTQDEIIRMAREAGFLISTARYIAPHQSTTADIERFAALVAAHEREKQAEQEPVAWWNGKETAFFEHELCGLKAPAEFHTPLYAAPVHPISQELSEREMTKPKQRICECGDKCFPIFSHEREYCETCGWPIYTFDEHRARLLEEKK